MVMKAVPQYRGPVAIMLRSLPKGLNLKAIDPTKDNLTVQRGDASYKQAGTELIVEYGTEFHLTLAVPLPEGRTFGEISYWEELKHVDVIPGWYLNPVIVPELRKQLAILGIDDSIMDRLVAHDKPFIHCGVLYCHFSWREILDTVAIKEDFDKKLAKMLD